MCFRVNLFCVLLGSQRKEGVDYRQLTYHALHVSFSICPHVL